MHVGAVVAVLVAAALLAVAAGIPIDQHTTRLNVAPRITIPDRLVVERDSVGVRLSDAIIIQDEDVALDFDGVLNATLCVSRGRLQFRPVADTVLPVAPPSSLRPCVTAIGSVPAVADVLQSLFYVPPPAAVGADAVAITVDDGGFTGTGGPHVVHASLPVSIVALESALPVLALPTARLVTPEDMSMDVDAQIAGLAPDTALQVTLTAPAGTLRTQTHDFASTVTLSGTFAAVNTELADLRFMPAPHWNSEKNGETTVQLCAQVVGAAAPPTCSAVTILVAAVNDAPTITLASALQSNPVVLQEDTHLTLEDVTVGDVDVSDTFGGFLTINISLTPAAAGALWLLPSAEPLAQPLQTAQSLVFHGIPALLNQQLPFIHFVPTTNWNGDATVTITLADHGYTGGEPLTASQTLHIQVVAVNDAPAFTTPSQVLTVVQDTPVAVPAITVADVDIGNAIMTLTLQTTHGAVDITTIPDAARFVVGLPTKAQQLTVTAPLRDINTMLSHLRFHPEPGFISLDGAVAAIDFSIEDNADSVAQLTLTFLVQPTATAIQLRSPAAVALDSTATLVPVAGVLLSVTPDLHQLVRLSIAADHGAVAVPLPAGSVLISGQLQVGTDTPCPPAAQQCLTGSSITLDAPADVLVGVLADLVFQNTHVETDTAVLTFEAAVGDTRARASTQLNIRPTITLPKLQVLQTSISLQEDVPATISGVSLIPGPHSPAVVAVLCRVAHGVLSLTTATGIRFAASMAGLPAQQRGATLQFSGTVADMNAALATLTYTSTADWNGPDALDVSIVADAAAQAPAAQTAQVQLMVLPVNDAPVISAPASVGIQWDARNSFPTITIADVDLGETPSAMLGVTVGLSPPVGNLIIDAECAIQAQGRQVLTHTGIVFEAGSIGAPATQLAFRSSVQLANLLLSCLQYDAPLANGPQGLALAPPPASLIMAIQATDGGATGSGPIGRAAASITLQVLPFSSVWLAAFETPTLTALEDTRTTLPAAALSSDAVDSTTVLITIEAGYGAIHLGTERDLLVDAFSSIVAVGISTPTDAWWQSVTIQGTARDVNAALSQLSYVSAPDWNSDAHGADVVGIYILTSKAQIGKTDALAPAALLRLWVQAVNDAPVLTAPSTPLLVHGAKGRLLGLNVSDVDVNEAHNGAIAVNLTVQNGALWLDSHVALTVLDGSNRPVLLPKTPVPTLRIIGSLAAVDAALTRLWYQPAAPSITTDTLHVLADDFGFSGIPDQRALPVQATIPIVITPDLQLPSLACANSAAARPLQIAAGQPAAVFADCVCSGGSATAVQFTFTVVAPASLALPPTIPVGVLTNGSDTMLSVLGAPADACPIIRQITYIMPITVTSAFLAADTILVMPKDVSFGRAPVAAPSVSSFFKITRPLAPPSVRATNTSFSGVEDKPLTLAAIVLSDDAAVQRQQLRSISLRVSHGGCLLLPVMGGLQLQQLVPPDVIHSGLLSPQDTPFVAASIIGAVPYLNAALAKLTFVPEPGWSGSATVDYSAFGTSGTLTITVTPDDDVPILFAPAQVETFDEDTQATFAITIDNYDHLHNPERLVGTLQISTPSGALQFQVAALGRGKTLNASDSSLVWAASITDMRSLLAQVVFIPPADAVGLHSVSAQILLPDMKAVSNAVTTMWVVAPVNDPPTLRTTNDTTPSVDQAAAITLATVQLVDPDLSSVLTLSPHPNLLQLNISAGAGTIQLPPPASVAAPAASLSLQLSAPAATAALAGIRYIAPAGWYGTDVVEIHVSDQGNSGSGPVGVAQLLLPVRVLRKPLRASCVLQHDHVFADEDTPSSPLAGASVTLSDAAAAVEVVHVNLTAWAGIIVPPSLANVAVTMAPDNSSALYRGLAVHLAPFLQQTRFVPAHDFNGAWRSGGVHVPAPVHSMSQTQLAEMWLTTCIASVCDPTTSTVAHLKISVNPVNDAPVLTLPPAVHITPGVRALVPGLAVQDVDVAESALGRLYMSLTTDIGFLSIPTRAVTTFSVRANTSPDAIEAGLTTCNFNGTLAALNTILASLTLLPPPASATALSGHITVVISDNGFSGSGGARQVSGQVPVSMPAGGFMSPLDSDTRSVSTSEGMPVSLAVASQLFSSQLRTTTSLSRVAMTTTGGSLLVTPVSHVKLGGAAVASAHAIVVSAAVLPTVHETQQVACWRNSALDVGTVDVVFRGLRVSIDAAASVSQFQSALASHPAVSAVTVDGSAHADHWCPLRSQLAQVVRLTMNCNSPIHYGLARFTAGGHSSSWFAVNGSAVDVLHAWRSLPAAGTSLFNVSSVHTAAATSLQWLLEYIPAATPAVTFDLQFDSHLTAAACRAVRDTTHPGTSPWSRVTFTWPSGALPLLSLVPHASVGNISVAVQRITPGAAATVAATHLLQVVGHEQAEVHQVSISAAPTFGGTFRLSYDGVQTPDLNAHTSSAQLLLLLRALPGIGTTIANASVAEQATTSVWTIYYKPTAGDIVQPTVVSKSALAGSTLQVTVSTTTQGSLVRGSFKVALGSQSSASIPVGATAAQVQAGLQSIAGVTTVQVKAVTLDANAAILAGAWRAWWVEWHDVGAFSGGVMDLTVDTSLVSGCLDVACHQSATVTFHELSQAQAAMWGTVQLSFQQSLSMPLPLSASPQDVADALAALPQLPGALQAAGLLVTDPDAVADTTCLSAAPQPLPPGVVAVAGLPGISVQRLLLSGADKVSVAWIIHSQLPNDVFTTLQVDVSQVRVQAGQNVVTSHTVPVSATAIMLALPTDIASNAQNVWFVPQPFWNSLQHGVALVSMSLQTNCSLQFECDSPELPSTVAVNVGAVDDKPAILGCNRLITDEDTPVLLSSVSLDDADDQDPMPPASRLFTFTVTPSSGLLRSPRGAAQVSVLQGRSANGNSLLDMPQLLSALPSRDTYRTLTVKGSLLALRGFLEGLQFLPPAHWSSATQVPSVQVVTTSARPASHAQTITLYTSNGHVNGSFILAMNLTTVGGNYRTTGAISVDAVAARLDERHGAGPGHGIGQSMESQLAALLSSVGATVTVVRSTSDLHGNTVWFALFQSNRTLPALTVHSTSLSCVRCTTPATVSVALNSSAHNLLGGTFTLTANGHTTAPLASDVSAEALQAALNALPGSGGITVSRTGPSDTRGYAWSVTFAHAAFPANIVAQPFHADGAGLTGIGAAIQSQFIAGDVATLQIDLHLQDPGSAHWVVDKQLVVLVRPVPSAPLLTRNPLLPTHYGSPEDAAVALGGLQLSDPDSALRQQPSVTVSILSGFGTVQFQVDETLVDVQRSSMPDTELWWTPFERHRLTLTGQVAAVQFALNNLTYSPFPDYHGWEDLAFAACIDGLCSNPVHLSINITSVNDAPVLVLPEAELLVTEATVPTALVGIAVVDIDIEDDEFQLMDLTVSVGSGFLSISPAASMSVQIGCGQPLSHTARLRSICLRGTAATVTTATAGILYRADAAGGDTLQVVAFDGHDTTRGSVSFTVRPAAPAGSLRAPAVLAVSEDGSLPLTSIVIGSVTDKGATVVVSYTATHGTVVVPSVPEIQILPPSGGGPSLVGVVAQVNRTMASAMYTPSAHWNGWDPVTVSLALVTAGAQTVRLDSKVIWLHVQPVNDAPTISLPPDALLTTTVDNPIILSGVVVADVDAESSAALLQLSLHVGMGTLELTGSSSPVGDGPVHELQVLNDAHTVRFTADVVTVNRALGRILYTPAPAWAGADTLSITAVDMQQVSTTANLTVRVDAASVNALSLRLLTPRLEVLEDTALIVSNLIVPPFVDDTAAVRLQVSAVQGRVTLNADSLVRGPTTMSDFIVDVPVNELRKAITDRRLYYVPATNFVGRDRISVLVSASGIPSVTGLQLRQTMATIIVDVMPVNDAPTISATASSPISLRFAEEVIVSSWGIQIADVEAVQQPSNTLQLAVRVPLGCGQWLLPFPIAGVTLVASTSPVTLAPGGALQQVPVGASFEVSAALGALTTLVAHPLLEFRAGNMTTECAALFNVTDDGGLSATTSIQVVVQPPADVKVQVTSSQPAYVQVSSPDVVLFAPVSVAVQNYKVSDALNVEFSALFGSLHVADGDGVRMMNASGLQDDRVQQTVRSGRLIGALGDINKVLRLVSYKPSVMAGQRYRDVVRFSAWLDGQPPVASNILLVTLDVTLATPAPTVQLPAAISATEPIVPVPNAALLVSEPIDTQGGYVLNVRARRGMVQVPWIPGLHVAPGASVDSCSGKLCVSTPAANITVLGTVDVIGQAIQRIMYHGAADKYSSDTVSAHVVDPTGQVSSATTTVTLIKPRQPLAVSLKQPMLTLGAEDDQIMELGVRLHGEDDKATVLLSISWTGDVIAVLVPPQAEVAVVVDQSAIWLGGHVEDINLALANATVRVVRAPSVGFLAAAQSLIQNRLFACDLSSAAATKLVVATMADRAAASGITPCDAKAIAVRLSAVNDAPVIQAPSEISTDEDTPFALDMLSIVDADANAAPEGPGIMSMNLTVLRGQLQVTKFVAGLFIAAPFVKSSDLSSVPNQPLQLHGTLADLNAALSAVVYTPPENFSGDDALHIVVTDNGWWGEGAVGTDDVTVRISVVAVNDSPNIVMPAMELVEREDITIPLYRAARIQVTDSDIGDQVLTVTLTVAHGALTLYSDEGLRFLDGTKAINQTRISFQAQLAHVTRALWEVLYAPFPDFAGADTLLVRVSDGHLSAEGVAGVFIHAVNKAPRIRVPSSALEAEEDTLFRFGSAIQVGDTDATETPGAVLRTSVFAAHGGSLEVQTVAISATHVDAVQVITVSNRAGAALSGTFSLRLDMSAGGYGVATTTPIRVDATPRVGDEVTGAGANLAPGASVEAALLGLSNFLDMEVDVTRTLSTTGPSWTVTFKGAPAWLPQLTVATNAVSPASNVTVQTLVPGNPLGGTFELCFAGACTVDVPYSATAAAVKEALEDLPEINVVDVHVDMDAALGLQGGRRWRVTFFDPSGDIEAMSADTTALTGLGARVDIEETAHGFGIPALYNITVKANHVDEVQVIALSSASALSGWFTVSLDLGVISPELGYAETAPIAFNAVPSTSDEYLTHASGTNYTEAVQSRLMAMLDVIAHRTVPGPWRTIVKGMHVDVEKAHPCGTDANCVSWTVTFRNAPWDLPAMRIAQSQRLFSASNTAIMAGVSTSVEGNNVAGSYQLSSHGYMTASLAFNAGASQIADALMELPSIRTTSPLNVGRVQVVCGPRRLEDGQTCIVALVQQHPLFLAQLGVNGAQLTGYGGLVTVQQIRDGGDNAVLRLAGDIGERASVDSAKVQPRQLLWTATPVDTNMLLNSLEYISAPNWNGQVTIAVRVDDLGSTGLGGPLSSWAMATLMVRAVNDPPVILMPQVYMGAEDADLPINTLVIRDVDADGGAMILTARVQHGVLRAFHQSASVTGTGTDTVTVRGTLRELNEAMSRLVYRPAMDFYGMDLLWVEVQDLGHFGVTHGAAYVDPSFSTPAAINGQVPNVAGHTVSQYSRLMIQAVNDQPYVVLTPDTVHVFEDNPLPLDAVSFTDVDADDAVNTDSLLLVSVRSSSGRLDLPAVSGSSQVIVHAANWVDVLAPLAALNAAMHRMTWLPDQDSTATATIQVDINDRGNTGSGGALQHSQTLQVIVDAVNDLPVVIAPPFEMRMLEDSELPLVGVDVLDVDSATITVAVTATDGVISAELVSSNVQVLAGPIRETKVLVLSGPTPEVAIAVRGLLYRPPLNWNSLVHGVATVTIAAYDRPITAADAPLHHGDRSTWVTWGAAPSQSVGEVTIRVVPVNDQPVLTVPGQAVDPVLTTMDNLSPAVIGVPEVIVVAEDTDHVVAGIIVRDVDAEETTNGMVEISLYSSNGTFTLSQGTAAPVFALIAGTGRGDSTVIFRASVEAANAALAGLVYRGRQDFNGPDHIIITVSDLGNTGEAPLGFSGPLLHTLDMPVLVTPVNDAPLAFMAPVPLRGLEGAQVTIDNMYVADVDSGLNVTVTVTVDNGYVSLMDTVPTLVFLHGTGTLDRSVTCRGRLSHVNKALSSAVYLPLRQWNSLFKEPDTIHITVFDGELSNSASRPVIVDPANNAPEWHSAFITRAIADGSVTVITHVNRLTVNEDTPMSLGDMHIEDVDADEGYGSQIEVQVECSHGTLVVDPPAGLTFLLGTANGERMLAWQSTLANANKALQLLRYTGDLNFVGDDTITATVNDMGFTGVGPALEETVVVNVTVLPVNDAPVWHIPSRAFVVEEDAGLLFSGISISDVDDDGGLMRVVMNVTQGVVTLERISDTLSFEVGDGDRDKAITIVGDKEAINEALEALSYVPPEDWNNVLFDRDSLSLEVSDLGNTGSGGPQVVSTVVYVQKVAGVNDAPIIHVKGEVRVQQPCDVGSAVDASRVCGKLLAMQAWQVPEDSDLVITGTSIEDIDLDQTFGATLEVALSCYHGVLSLRGVSGLTFLRGDGLEDQVVSFRGTLVSVNWAVSQITYRGAADFYGPDNMTITVTDQGFTGLGGALWDEVTVPITVTSVNDQVTWTIPTRSTTITEEDKLPLTGISVSDVDSLNGLLEVHVSVKHGQMSIVRMNGLSFINETAPGRTAGHQVALNMDLSGRPLTGDSGWQIAQSVIEGADSSGAVFELEIGSQFGFRGTLDDVNTALTSLLYDGKLNFNTAGKDKDEITLYVTDLGNSGNGAPTSDTQLIYVQVLAKNDAPVVSVPGATYSSTLRNEDELEPLIIGVATIVALEDTRIDIVGVSVHDVDVEDGADGKLTVTLTAEHGTVSLRGKDDPVPSGLAFTVGTGYNDKKMVFTGAMARLNELLAALSYLGDQDYTGLDSLLVSVSDNGFYGTGGVKTDSQTIPIDVKAINDAPVITVPRHANGSSTLHIVESAEIILQGVMFHEASVAQPVAEVQTGQELWFTRGFQPLVANETGMLVDKHDGAFGLGESWRLSLVTDLFKGMQSSNPSFLTAYDGSLFFSGTDGRYGRELWRTDGTAATTRMVKDTLPGADGGDPRYITQFEGKLYFAADGIDTNWMLRTDSCSGFRQSSYAPSLVYAVSASTDWVPGRVYDCPSGYHWASTVEAQRVLPETPTGAFSTYPSQASDAGIGGALTEADASQPTYYDQCGWDGFTWGGATRTHFRFADSHVTGAFKPVGSPDGSPVIMDDFHTAHFAGIVCVPGDDSACRTKSLPCLVRAGAELWTSDGTDAGTVRVSDIRPGLSGSDPAFIVPFTSGGVSQMLFAATTDPFGRELWASDGTAQGTLIVEDIRPGFESSNPSYLTAVGSLVMFAANDGFRGEELWATTGISSATGAGTFLVLDIHPGAPSSQPRYLTAVHNKLFFSADDGIHGTELWVSDGTVLGTMMVADINPGPEGSNPSYITAYNGVAYFQADDGTVGSELWRSDGTAAGTLLVADIQPGFASSKPVYLSVFTPRPSLPAHLFFFVSSFEGSGTGPGGSELWYSDGTEAGTSRAFQLTGSELELGQVMDDPYPAKLVEYRQSLFFTANRGRQSKLVPQGLSDNSPDGVAPGVQSRVVPQSISVVDVDAGLADLQFNLTCSKGVLTLRKTDGLVFSVGTGKADTTMVFTANLMDANVAFREILYKGRPLQNGEDKILITVDDKGWTGTFGTSQISHADVDVWIDEVNDAPFVSAPASMTVRQGDVLTIRGVTFSDPDLDSRTVYDVHGAAHAGFVRVHILPDSGTISLSTLEGLSFRKGTGIEDAQLIVEGSLADINAAVAQLRYVCAASDGCMLGEHGIHFIIEDNGYSGGKPLSFEFTTVVAVVFNPAQ